MTRYALVLALIAASQAAALELPGTATPTAERSEASGTLSLPTGPWTPDGIERAEESGSVLVRAWRVPQTSLTTLQLLAPLRESLAVQGQEILYECADRACGGFDFRYALELLPEPAMHVDLGDYRYLAAREPESGLLTGIVVSRGSGSGYIHIARVSPPDSAGAPAAEPADAPAGTAPSSDRPVPAADPVIATSNDAPIAERLRQRGRAVLSDLVFPTGSSELDGRAFPSLAELAAYLRATPDARVVLVGHSDAEGALDSNIALSRRRAESVVQRLVAAHGVAPGQLRAEGVGYLAPIAPNVTQEGRAANRRVEVIEAETD